MSFDTVTLKSTSSTVSTALIDGPTNQKTLRSSADRLYKIAAAHQLTSENGKDVETQRSNVRITRSKEIGDTGDSVDGYVQFSMSLPRDHFSAAEAQALVLKLMNYLTDPAGSAVLSIPDNELLAVPRLYAGES